MDKEKYMWGMTIVIFIGDFIIMYGRSNSNHKTALTLILLGFSICLIPFICLIIGIIKQNINLKMYGSEEAIKIEDIIIKQRNIDKYTRILSNGKADNYNEEELIKNFTIKVSVKTKTEELLKNVNGLLDEIGYNLHISEEDILKKDYEFIRNRREKGYSTLTHDINVIINILNSYNLEAINIINKNEGDINMGIVSFDKLEELNELGEYDENIEE